MALGIQRLHLVGDARVRISRFGAQIHQRARPEDASRAEQTARACGSLRRSIDFTKREFDAARAERDVASAAVDERGQVVAALQGELRGIDERIAALQLDRQVIMHQLQAAVQSQSQTVMYKTECDMRLLELTRQVQAQSSELESRLTAMAQLAPGINVI